MKHGQYDIALETFPFCGHFTMAESARVEMLRDRLRDDQVLAALFPSGSTRKAVHELPARTFGEVVAYLRRNPKAPQVAA